MTSNPEVVETAANELADINSRLDNVIERLELAATVIRFVADSVERVPAGSVELELYV